jgi:NAD(P)-dependent dehydrogenase (short-subunit alcohol dehydrogenase family)
LLQWVVMVATLMARGPHSLEMKLERQSVLITGASRGLGAALAGRFARAGARVALVARKQPALERVVAEIRAAGGEAHGLVYDIADKRAIHPLAAAAAELVGPPDLLVHNASELGPVPLRLLLDTECEDFERVLAANLIGPFRLTRAVAGAMALRRRGTIVHLSSDASIHAYPRWGAYGVSKAALDHLARSLAAELGEHGVRVFSVDPGDMHTDLHLAAVPDADPQALADPDQVAAAILRMIESERIEPGARLEAQSWKESA